MLQDGARAEPHDERPEAALRTRLASWSRGSPTEAWGKRVGAGGRHGSGRDPSVPEVIGAGESAWLQRGEAEAEEDAPLPSRIHSSSRAEVQIALRVQKRHIAAAESGQSRGEIDWGAAQGSKEVGGGEAGGPGGMERMEDGEDFGEEVVGERLSDELCQLRGLREEVEMQLLMERLKQLRRLRISAAQHCQRFLNHLHDTSPGSAFSDMGPGGTPQASSSPVRSQKSRHCRERRKAREEHDALASPSPSVRGHHRRGASQTLQIESLAEEDQHSPGGPQREWFPYRQQQSLLSSPSGLQPLRGRQGAELSQPSREEPLHRAKTHIGASAGSSRRADGGSSTAKKGRSKSTALGLSSAGLPMAKASPRKLEMFKVAELRLQEAGYSTCESFSSGATSEASPGAWKKSNLSSSVDQVS